MTTESIYKSKVRRGHGQRTPEQLKRIAKRRALAQARAHAVIREENRARFDYVLAVEYKALASDPEYFLPGDETALDYRPIGDSE